MKRELRLYNVIFPIWLLFLFPVVLILVIPANLSVDSLVLLLTLLVVLQVRRIIGRPVRELSLAATRIAEGELDQTISYHSKDELGVLADDFNRVTLRLKD